MLKDILPRCISYRSLTARSKRVLKNSVVKAQNDKRFIIFTLFFLSSTLTFSSCQTRPLSESETFGSYNNVTLKVSDLTPQEKISLINAQKQLYETAQHIMEHRYLDSWFINYQIKHNFPNLLEAKKDYFKKNISIKEQEINEFIKENATNKELEQIPAEQKAPIVTQYLTRVAKAHLEQNMIEEAYKAGKIKLQAYQKPHEQKIQFEPGGYVFDPTLKTPAITIIEFADYQCPFCVKANSEIMNLVRNYRGKVQYIFRDFPLLDKHPQALPAALAAKCAGKQGKYWEMHELIFKRPPMGELSNNSYLNFATKLNLDLNEFKNCQLDPTQRESIQSDLNEGLRVGVNETPTIFIDGEKFDDYLSYEKLKAAVDAKLPN